jgi:hypothetical protein
MLKERINRGVMMTEVAAGKVSRGFRYTLAGAALVLPGAILEGWLDSETDDDRFSDHQLNRMGIERGSDRYERLVAEDKNCEALENQ